MWSFAVGLITSAVTSAFSWFQQILDSAPGAWTAIFTVFVILMIIRFLLGSVLDVSINAGSDRAADWVVEKRKNDRRSTAGLRKIAKKG